jgi:hypothetical protein
VNFAVRSGLPGAARAALIGGLAAGVIDILDAFAFSYARAGVGPPRVLQAIASGLLGRDAFAGGPATAALGLGLHFFIACSAAVVFVLAARAAPLLLRHPIASGAAYGVGVYVFMQQVVLPLSRFRGGGQTAAGVANGILIHAFGVGIPIALAAARFMARPASPVTARSRHRDI